MSVRSEESSDDTMGDGGYEILTDSTLMTDEEDDEASSVASFDEEEEQPDEEDGFVDEYGNDAGHGVDDRASSDTASSSTGSSVPSLAADSSAPIPSYDGLDQQDVVTGCHVTVRRPAAVRDRHGSSDEIVFAEPLDADQFYVPARYTLSPLSTLETAQFFRRLRRRPPPAREPEGGGDDADSSGDDDDDGTGALPALLRAVRLSMSRDLLEMEEPFRLLYVGPTAAKEEIQHKLAAALAVPISESTSSTRSWDSLKSPRFNIIPISSFGSRSISPEVELVDSSGLDMMVDVCTAARPAKPDGDRSEVLSLRLNGNQNVTSYSRPGLAHFQLDSPPGWKLPHLAAVYCADDDTSQRRLTRLHARAFMERHRVPVLVISQNSQCLDTIAAAAPDPRIVHLSIESESPDNNSNTIHKTLPVDLSTFLMLNPRQLNRHLRCITGPAPDDRCPPRRCAKPSAAAAATTTTTTAAAATTAANTAAASTATAATAATTTTTTTTIATTTTAAAAATNIATVESDPLLRDLEEAVSDGDVLDGMPSHYLTREKRREELWRVIFFGWFFFAALSGAVLGLAYVQFLEVHNEGPAREPATFETTVAPASLAPAWSKFQPPPPPTAPASVAWLGSATSTASSLSQSPSTPPSPSLLLPSPMSSVVEFKPRVAETTPNKSDQFEVSTVIGSEHVVIIRPPHKMLLLRRPPPVHVSVTREGDSVDALLSPLVDGIYTLVIGEEDAWGVLNVSVRTKTRPPIKSLLEIDFGNPWLRRRVRWRKITDQAATEARLLASRFSQSAGHQAAELGVAMLDMAREYSDMAREYSVRARECSIGLRKLYRAQQSVSAEQRAEYVRKAQQQALAIWTRGKQAMLQRLLARR